MKNETEILLIPKIIIIRNQKDKNVRIPICSTSRVLGCSEVNLVKCLTYVGIFFSLIK